MWNPKYRAEDMTSFRARYIFANNGIVNLGYRYRRNSSFRPGIDPPESEDLLEQADFSFLYPINPTWSVVGRYYYSILDKKELETIAGVQWESCCLAARLVGRRYLRNRDGELDTRIMFEFELKGLGSAGQNVERSLRRGILGYNRDDLYLVPPSSTERLNDGGGQVDSSLRPDPMKKLLASALAAAVLSAALPAATALAQEPQGSSSIQSIDGIAAVVDEDVILKTELDRAVTNILAQYAGRENQLPPRDVLRAPGARAPGAGQAAGRPRARAPASGSPTRRSTRPSPASPSRTGVSPEQLRQQLAREGTPYADFRSSIRDELLIQRLRQRFAQSRITVSEAEVDAAMAAQANSRRPVPPGPHPGAVARRRHRRADRHRAEEDRRRQGPDRQGRDGLRRGRGALLRQPQRAGRRRPGLAQRRRDPAGLRRR